MIGDQNSDMLAAKNAGIKIDGYYQIRLNLNMQQKFFCHIKP